LNTYYVQGTSRYLGYKNEQWYFNPNAGDKNNREEKKIRVKRVEENNNKT
jgi:hypothetical protein